MLREVFDRGLSRSFAALWFAGFLLCETAAVLAFRRSGSWASLPFVIPAIALFVLSVWTVLRQPWALAVGAALSAAQIAGTIGCILELRLGISTLKMAEMHALGVDPTAGVVVNLIYSIAGTALFAWALVRFLRLRNAGAGGKR